MRPCGGAYQGGTGVRQGTEKMIRFGTFNIWNRQNGVLESALCGVAQGWVDCGILQEMRLTNGVYTRKYSGFWVMATEASCAPCGGVAIFYCKVDHFAIEELPLHVPNVISFQVVTGRWRWNVMGCYIAPKEASTIEDVAAAIRD